MNWYRTRYGRAGILALIILGVLSLGHAITVLFVIALAIAITKR